MCREGETIYISCALDAGTDQYSYDGPVASICAKGNTSPDRGYVQYRYGTPSYGYSTEKLEMQYPEEKNAPKGIFKIYSSNHSESLGTALRFTSGEYVYSFESLGFAGYRVVVRKKKIEVFSKACTLPGKNYLIDEAYRGVEYINLGQEKISDAGE